MIDLYVLYLVACYSIPWSASYGPAQAMSDACATWLLTLVLR